MNRFQIEMVLLKFFAGALLKTSEKFRYKFAEGLGYLSYKLIKKRRIVTLNNIKNAFPEKTFEEIEKIAINSYKTMVKTFMMSLWMPDTCRDDSKVKFDNYALFEEAKAMGKGVVIASLHMGCFEAIQKVALTNELYDVIKPQKNHLLDEYMNENRRRTGIHLIYKGASSVKELVKALKNKDIVCLFSDHYDIGCEVEFFGKKTLASTGVAALGLKYDAPVLLVHNILDENNVSTIYFDKILDLTKTGNTKKDIDVNTQMLINEFECLIKKYPDQWMWFHRRWRD